MLVTYFGYLLRQVQMSDLSTLEDTVRVWHHQKWEKSVSFQKLITACTVIQKYWNLKPQCGEREKKEKNVQRVGGWPRTVCSFYFHSHWWQRPCSEASSIHVLKINMLRCALRMVDSTAGLSIIPAPLQNVFITGDNVSFVTHSVT